MKNISWFSISPPETYCRIKIIPWVASCDLESVVENNLNGDLANVVTATPF